ncbi:FAD-dependent oxidoreductase, partial [Gammaproteobacteria bacterium]|nr:FAD-dependent oxidoreductase [Gammaproteobacteria bacterium]
MKTDVLIIGAGQAGAMTAIALRQQKYNGSITIIGEEEHLPYQRPPLSKNFLDGITPTKNLYLKSSTYYKKNQIDILLNNSVISINRADKNINLKDGSKFYYKKLVIAVGSKLNILDIHDEKENIYYLKTIKDSIKIRSLLDQQKNIVIIGAGYIGLEIASAACKKNHQVTILEADNRIMSRSVCPETSHFFETMHEKKGVKFFFNALIKNIHQNDDQKIITLSNYSSINTDAVIIGVGVKPKIDLAVTAGLDCKNGITVNEFCQTSDNDIFAIGDCANYPNSIYSQRLRLESVHNAIEHAKIAASTINGEGLPHHQIPWFWSDQYNIKLRIAGVAKDYENYLIRGNMAEEKFSV